MKEPNNTRNRWRRYRDTRVAYGFYYLPFKEWIKTATKDSYQVRFSCKEKEQSK